MVEQILIVTVASVVQIGKSGILELSIVNEYD